MGEWHAPLAIGRRDAIDEHDLLVSMQLHARPVRDPPGAARLDRDRDIDHVHARGTRLLSA
jgi:hypothetical protein